MVLSHDLGRCFLTRDAKGGEDFLVVMGQGPQSCCRCPYVMAWPVSLSFKVLSKYRSGKLPKAFKIIPALSNWEQILYITEPETWTAAAMYQATR